MSLTRPGTAADLAAIGAIQAASPEAARWRPEDYLAFDLRVAICDDRVAGFAVSRITSPGECELLNIAVAPEFRRRGVGASLVQSLAASTVYLEVRESNFTARAFYSNLHFQEIGSRAEYYDSPPETAIVMKFHSC